MEEITKSYAVKRIAELNEEILQLRTDLLDKETELAKFKIKDTYGLSDFIDKSSKKLAIGELEKVKNYMNEYSSIRELDCEVESFIYMLDGVIIQQIQELKENL